MGNGREPSQNNLGNTLTTYQESMNLEKYEKRKTSILEITYIHIPESTNVKLQNICNIWKNIRCSMYCKYAGGLKSSRPRP
jgi:hypothetical protein